MHRIDHTFSLLILFLVAPLLVTAQEIAFPGAQGYGKFASGGRDGKIIMVTNLDDDGPGSLREALSMEFPRIILFQVAGTIKLESELDIKYGNVSILGQSAPGEGITLRDYPIKANRIENVIIRYIRSRLGDQSKYQGDAISINGCTNVIVDHCSFSWSSDESASIYDNTNSTVQYCMITESLNNSIHAKGEHGYGGIWGGMNASFHHNLFAHHKSRNPRFQGARYHNMPPKEIVDFVNNVIYNWGINNSYGGERGNHNIVNNYYKPGPASSAKLDRILDPYKPYGRFYVDGNLLEGDDQVSADNWKGVKNYSSDPDIRLMEPIAVVSMDVETARQAYLAVLEHAGASFCRDTVDRRVIQEVRRGTATFGKGIIDTQQQVGGWPVLRTGRIARDTDHDGIPDSWEKKRGLDPTDESDGIARTLNGSYSNIEVYLNSRLE